MKHLLALRDFAALLYARFNATDCPQVAGSLAFTTLLALVPLITVAIALFSNFPGFADLGTSLKVFLLENLLPERAGHIITTYALQFSEKATGLTLIGTALLVVTALLLLSTIDRVFNTIWGVREPRPLMFRIAVYWFALTLGPLVLGGSAFASGYLVSASMELVDLPWLGELSARLLPPLMLGGLFSYLYFAVPNHPVKPLHALAGGALQQAVEQGLLLLQRTLVDLVEAAPAAVSGGQAGARQPAAVGVLVEVDAGGGAGVEVGRVQRLGGGGQAEAGDEGGREQGQARRGHVQGGGRGAGEPEV